MCIIKVADGHLVLLTLQNSSELILFLQLQSGRPSSPSDRSDRRLHVGARSRS